MSLIVMPCFAKTSGEATLSRMVACAQHCNAAGQQGRMGPQKMEDQDINTYNAGTDNCVDKPLA